MPFLLQCLSKTLFIDQHLIKILEIYTLFEEINMNNYVCVCNGCVVLCLILICIWLTSWCYMIDSAVACILLCSIRVIVLIVLLEQQINFNDQIYFQNIIYSFLCVALCYTPNLTRSQHKTGWAVCNGSKSCGCALVHLLHYCFIFVIKHRTITWS